ncbi:MAG TPA: DedA family protein [Balneolaceae bacterium]|nr:DedA family protein [Balneolaceae bacterium]
MLPSTQEIIELIHSYGALGLFSFLALGVLGLPIPDETLLMLSGYLVGKGEESYFLVALAAFCGSAMGISLNFIIGHYPVYELIAKYGHWIHLTEEKYQKANSWFRQRGKILLTVGYFIPGIRHLSAIAAGAAGLRFRIFAIYAWSGALLWTNTFLLLGFYTGKDWLNITKILHRYIIWFVLVVFLVFLGYYLVTQRAHKFK